MTVTETEAGDADRLLAIEDALATFDADRIVLVDPEGVVDASPRGLNDLYVALTRATRSLAVVHPGDLPSVLDRLASG